MAMKEYTVLLADADGTLFDYDRAEEQALELTFRAFALAYAPEVRAKYRKINSALWRAFERGETTAAELQTERFRRLFQLLSAQADAIAFNASYLEALGLGSFLCEDAMQVCGELVRRGKKLFIVTNGIPATQRARLAGSALRDCVSDIFISGEIGYQKPQKEYFDHVLKTLGSVPKEQILVLGDSLFADIAGGKAAGLDTAWYNPQGLPNPDGSQPDYEMKSLMELLEIMG